ncbi:MAG TPA: hypothetical protein VGQ06_05755 [Gemmatimonadales bacterium]|jgi:hypothetical protein|nr:hypothetical protein [Gemmatimonadales bacterium]
MKRMTVLAVVIAAFGGACSDQRTPLSPRAGDSQPFADIVDGHTDPTRSQFFFLSPIRPSSLQPPATGFNASLRPVVEIYECTLRPDGTGCGALGRRVSRLTMDDPSAIDRLYVLPDLKKYVVLWRTSRVPDLNATKFYRIQVKVGPRVLGYADVDIVRTFWQLLGVDRDDFVPTFEDFVLPIAFWIGNAALCEPGSAACSSETIKLAEGGTVRLEAAGEDFRLDIRAGTAATSGGLPVTDVTFNLELCDGIDVDLVTFGQCLRVTTLFATSGPPAPLELTKQALISLCLLEPGLLPAQERLITLHQQDLDVIRALPHAAPSCGTISARSTGLVGLASAGWHAVWDFAGGLIAPRPLYARSTAVVFDLGGGGETDLFGSPSEGSSSAPFAVPAPGAAAAAATGMTVSDFQFALPAKMAYVNPDDASRTAPPGSTLPTAVQVTDWSGAPVQGATVTFTKPGGDVGVVLGTATSDVNGIAQVGWPIVEGTNTLLASGRGIAARNNYLLGDVKPFMPDLSLPGPSAPGCVLGVACQEAVVLGTGIVPFAATGRLAIGALAFVQQPTDQIANLRTLVVAVRAQDEAGAVLPGVLVTLKDGPQNGALGCGMAGAELTALTDETGRATFSLIAVSNACEGATLLATGSKVGFAAMSVESRPFAIADIGGSGTATIDGIFGPGEWATAVCLSFSATIPEGGTTPALLCAMNDAANVYFLVRFSRARDPQSSVDFQFDQNRSGTINSGDDLITFRNPTFTFEDDHWFDSSVDPACPVGRICSRSDASAGGASNGQGAFGNNGGETIFEVSHPLSSGDTRDISVAVGQTIDFFLGLNIYDQAGGTTFSRTFFQPGLLKLLVK